MMRPYAAPGLSPTEQGRLLQVGFKLFGFELRVASRLVWKRLQGATLSRRERRQLTRTSADIFRVVPFSLFIIIPFAEVLLPVALRVFPNMLPSTFETPLKQVRYACI
jgi:LETM1 and EF-hand domain-containing protein 1, mitochondrial